MCRGPIGSERCRKSKAIYGFSNDWFYDLSRWILSCSFKEILAIFGFRS